MSIKLLHGKNPNIMRNSRTKENWLTDAVTELEREFAAEGLIMPAKWRISSGFPSKGGLAAKRRTIGQCWSPSASADATTEIIMQAEPMVIIETVAHEMVHAVVDVKNGHNKIFGKMARAIGLEGKLTATYGGDAFKARVAPIVKRLSDYPHAALDHTVGQKKQTTRMIKVTCTDDDCGMVFRTSRKWAEKAEIHEMTLACPLCNRPCNHG